MYQTPFRQAVLRVYEYTKSMRKTATICGVSVASICRWQRRLEPKKWTRGARVLLSDALVASVDAFMRKKTVMSAIDVVQFIKGAWDITVSRQLAYCIIRRLGFTFKRTRKRGGGNCPTKPRGGEGASSFFERFLEAMARGVLVAVDESGFDQRCRPVYGYAPAGSPAIADVPRCKDRSRQNLLMAIHQSGSSHYALGDSCTNASSFSAFLAGTPYPPGTTVLLDNVGFHRAKPTLDAAARRGYSLLFTPPYSPEYNPIELVFGIVKRRFYRERYSAAFGQEVRPVVERCVRECATADAVQGCFEHVRGLIRREQ